MARKQWSTTLDENKLKRFQDTCELYGMKGNTVLEALMDFFSDGNCRFVVEKGGCRLEVYNDNNNGK